MKFIVPALFFLFFGFTGSVMAQQVTLDDLMKEDNHNKNRGSKKKWVYELSRLSDRDSSMFILKSEFNKFEKSGNWMANDEEVGTDLSYQTMKKMYVDRFISDIKSAGFTLLNSKISEDSRTLVYSKNEVNIEILSYTPESHGGVTLYLVSLLK